MSGRMKQDRDKENHLLQINALIIHVIVRDISDFHLAAIVDVRTDFAQCVTSIKDWFGETFAPLKVPRMKVIKFHLCIRTAGVA